MQECQVRRDLHLSLPWRDLTHLHVTTLDLCCEFLLFFLGGLAAAAAPTGHFLLKLFCLFLGGFCISLRVFL